MLNLRLSSNARMLCLRCFNFRKKILFFKNRLNLALPSPGVHNLSVVMHPSSISTDEHEPLNFLYDNDIDQNNKHPLNFNKTF